jgi:broad specificity phosphatase PhoE
MKILTTQYPETRTITFMRHLESKYNEYKELIKTDPHYQQFLQETNGEIKEELAHILMKDFFENVGIDYETQLSSQGHQQGEKIGKLYATLVHQHPEIFPDIIYISPYLRTRLTAHYLLKEIEGLDIDFEKLTDEKKLTDLILGEYQGKQIAIKIDERIRERDFGANIAPSYIRNYISEKGNYADLLSEKQRDKMQYYTAPQGGESQSQVNERTKNFLTHIYDKEEYKNILIVSHHLAIISTLLSIFGGSFESFHQIDTLWKPKNGSFTFLSQIPETERGRENKFRISGYNLSLEE